MRMERRSRNGRRAGIMQKARIRLQRIQERAIDIEKIDVMSFRAGSEHRRMFMHGQSTQGIFRGTDGFEGFVFADIPELDLAVAAAGDEFAETAALHVHVRDPLFVGAPAFDHGLLRAEALVENADGTVAVATDEDVAGDLV